MLRCWASSSSIKRSFFTFLFTKLEMWLKAPSSASLLTGFSRYANAPHRRVFLLFSTTEMTCTGMWRVRGFRFSRSRMLHPSTTGSWMVQRGWRGLQLVGQRKAGVAPGGQRRP